jgi:hypothetical protein
VLGGGFYRPERAGTKVAEGGGSGGVHRSTPGAAALGACWRGEVMASGHCGLALASSRRSVACREAEGKGEGSGPFSSLFPESLGRGPGR